MKSFELIFPLVFPFFFIGMWCLVLRILSIMSGWTRLADKFHTVEKFQGKYYRFQSGRMKQVNFSSSLEMGVSEKGLFLVPMVLFRLFHKPLLIPWGEIHAEPFKRFLYSGYRLTFRSFPDIQLEVPARTFDRMVEHLRAKTEFQSAAAFPRDARAGRPGEIASVSRPR